MNPDVNQTVDEISFFVPNDSGRFSISIIIATMISSRAGKRDRHNPK